MKKIFLFLSFFIVFINFGGCKCHPSLLKQDIVLRDSFVFERNYRDTFVKIPQSYVPLAINPNSLKEGESRDKKEGQARVKIVKLPGDSILVTATCDSLEVEFKYLQEKMTRLLDRNEKLEKEVKSKPKRITWFLAGVFLGLLLGLKIKRI